jgi:hypothetical protein
MGAAAGCGGGSGGKSLDCTYLASDNCWKTTAAAASACLPADTEVGTLSADGKTCTYASGVVVTFAKALALPIPTSGSQAWSFTVTGANGDTCLSYTDDPQASITLTVQGQTVKETTPGGLGLALTCPDGTSYSNSNALSLLSCPDADLFSSLPGDAWSSTDTSVSLSLVGTSGSGLSVFNCQTAS